MEAFSYQGSASRIAFGAGLLAQLPQELDRLGVSRALVLTTPGQRALGERVAALLGERSVGVYAGAVMHVPVDAAQAARDEAQRLGADGYVAVGGGSTIGLGKAIALESAQPIIAVPTTYAGSEVTPIYGLTEGRLKRTGRDVRVLPKTVLYDPELTLTLPTAESAASGINAMAHSVEALYAQDANPVISLMAEESIRALAQALPQVVSNPDDIDARSRALYGAWLAGICLGTVGMALHHKLCHTLGGTFNLPHAQTHAVMLPHTAHYNHRAAPEALTRVARALGGSQAAQAGALLFELNRKLGIPAGLHDIGMPETGIDEAATVASANPYANPAPIDHDRIRALLTRAYRGEAPA